MIKGDSISVTFSGDNTILICLLKYQKGLSSKLPEVFAFLPAYKSSCEVSNRGSVQELSESFNVISNYILRGSEWVRLCYAASYPKTIITNRQFTHSEGKHHFIEIMEFE